MHIKGWIGFAWSTYLSVPTCFQLCSAAGLKVISPLFFSLSSSWANTCQTWYCIKILMTYTKCSLEVWLAAQIRSQVFIYKPLQNSPPPLEFSHRVWSTVRTEIFFYLGPRFSSWTLLFPLPGDRLWSGIRDCYLEFSPMCYKIISSFTISFNEFLLITYYVCGTMLGAENTVMYKMM